MNRTFDRPLALVIVDGWGFSTTTRGNAIAAAHTPNYDAIRSRYPWTTLAASGSEVGLESGQAGNAEIGHMNIGGGRVVKTVFSRIQESIRTGDFFSNEAIGVALRSANERGAAVHLIGMISDSEVHASMDSMYALLRMAKNARAEQVYIHGILDGRDTRPRSADVFVEAAEIKMAEIGIGKFATLCGRFYAMDSSENWERTARAFTMLTFGEGERASDAVAAIRNSFLRGISEEFIAPIVLESEPGKPVAKIASGDLVIFFNHRADTMRQLVRSLAVPDQGIVAPASKPWIETVCLAEYDRAFKMPVAFPTWHEGNSLSEVFAAYSVNNLRITETDRVPHLSRLFNCGSETGGANEQTIEIAAGNTVIRESEPEMQSFKITDRLLRGMEAGVANVFIVNIPSPGLIAETGNFDRTVEAVQYVDTCLGGIVEKVNEMNGIALITASHGNCEEMVDQNGQPHRKSTANPVPMHLVGPGFEDVDLRHDGSLCDIAPTVLELMGIARPAEMSGRGLFAG